MRARFYTAPVPQPTEVPFEDIAPILGMDGNAPLFNMGQGKAVYLYNIVPADYGCRTREGHRVWAQNISANKPINTVLPFTGRVADLSLARLFAVTSDGIYNITTQGTDNPTITVTFPDQSVGAGFCESIHFTDATGNQVLIVADSLNGMYEYDPNGSVWTKLSTEITGVDPTKVAFVTQHKGRIWMIERDSPDAWYLPVGAKAGAATKFQFGSKMRHGGYLVALLNWSIDGGEGLDDYLLAISKSGDLLAYKGSDPAQASTWSLVGNWYIGDTPAGRRIGAEVGGDTLVVSAFGVTSAARLLQGVDPTRFERNVTGKITRLVRDAIQAKGDMNYWQMVKLPEESSLTINSPKKPNERHIQFFLNLNRTSEESGGGWGLWRDLPATHFETFLGSVYFGTEGGTVCQMIGSLDNVDINNQGGEPVNFSLLTRFSSFDAPGVYKQLQYIRPQFLSTAVVEASCRAVYDFDITELRNPPALNPPPEGAIWNTDRWDQALWSGLASDYVLSGASGYGRKAAISIQGNATTRLTLLGVEGTWTRWNFL